MNISLHTWGLRPPTPHTEYKGYQCSGQVVIFSSLGPSMCEACPRLCTQMPRQCATSTQHYVEHPLPQVQLPVRQPWHPLNLLPDLHTHLYQILEPFLCPPRLYLILHFLDLPPQLEQYTSSSGPSCHSTASSPTGGLGIKTNGSSHPSPSTPTDYTPLTATQTPEAAPTPAPTTSRATPSATNHTHKASPTPAPPPGPSNPPPPSPLPPPPSCTTICSQSSSCKLSYYLTPSTTSS